MKTLSRSTFAAAFCSGLVALSAGARPIEFNEVSLLVRSHETTSDILQEARTRKLAQPLTANQESILRAQGADDALLRDLRDRALLLSPEEAAGFAQEQERAARHHASGGSGEESLGHRVHIFEVSYGHPISLSQWGGAAGEITFRLRRDGCEEVVEPVLLDRSTISATYLGQGRPDDATTIFDRREYVSAISYDRSRPGSIDLNNPVMIKGVPYNLYPVCAAGGVSLYYIGKSGNAVRLAVVTSKT